MFAYIYILNWYFYCAWPVSRGRAEWGLIWDFDIMITYTSIVVAATYQDRGLIWSFDIMITLKEMLKKLNGYSYLSSAPWTRDVWCIKRVRTALDVRIIGYTNWSCRQQEKKKVVGKLTSFNPGKTMFKLLAIVAVFCIQAAFCTCKFATDWIQFRCVHGYTFSNFEAVNRCSTSNSLCSVKI
jgi:hypothetical protein